MCKGNHNIPKKDVLSDGQFHKKVGLALAKIQIMQLQTS